MRRTPEQYTEQARATIGKNISMGVPWFLMASFLYYQHDIPLLTDEFFDSMCKQLLARWDEVEHMHKHLIDREHLSAGTGFDITEYPSMVQGAAWHLLRN